MKPHAENTEFLLGAEDVPAVLREWMDMLYPGDEWKEWFVEKNCVYKGHSPQVVLSVRHDRHPEELRRNVEKMVKGFYDVLSFVGVHGVASPDEVYDAVVAAQDKMLEHVLRAGKKRRDRERIAPAKAHRVA